MRSLKLDFNLPNWLFLHISSKYGTFKAFRNYLVTNETASNLYVAAHDKDDAYAACVCVVVSDSLGRVFHIFPSWPFSFPQISVNELEPEIAAATDCKIVTYNKGLWVIPSPKTRPAARRRRCQRVKTMVKFGRVIRRAVSICLQRGRIVRIHSVYAKTMVVK